MLLKSRLRLRDQDRPAFDSGLDDALANGDLLPVYTTAWRAKYLERIGLSTARLSPRFSKWHVLAKGGWHFTSIKDAHGLVTKLRAYSHTEYAGVDPDQLALQLEGIRQGETLPGHERCEIDEHMPQSVRANRERISQFIL